LGSNPASKKIAVYGAGAWGTALAIRWADRHDVTLIARRAEHVAAMEAARENVRYLPGSLFPKTLKTAPQVLPDVEWIVLGVPTSGLIDALNALQAYKSLPLIALCKGFIGDAAALPAAQISQRWRGSHAVLSGPSFAQEVARGLPTAVTIASSDAAFAAEAARALADDSLRIYPTTDVIGVEIGGAVKNVLAIAAGLCDGLALGANARAALLTRGLAEATRLAVALGGQADTLAGLAGMGDLVLTATGDLSRNRRVGLGLAAGHTPAEIVATLGHVAEGIPAAQNVLILAKNAKVEMPICSAVAQLLTGNINAHEAVAALMRRATPGL
jgi:glycerol-3-phosphate dehydrogenase (NAD(P)+)